MATSAPRTLTDLPLEFRAPPPSPAAGGGVARNGETENDEFGGFLNRSVRVPQLVLPDRILNRRETAAPWAPLEIDMLRIDGEMLRSAARSGGCFKIVGHGIGREVIERVGVLGGRAFRLPPEVKRAVSRTGERRWGFEVEEEESEGEEFLWWNEKGGEELAGIWPKGHKKFRRAMQSLWGELENIASKIGLILLQDNAQIGEYSCSSRITTIKNGSILYLHKPARNQIQTVAGQSNLLKHDTLRMLIRSSICSHSLHFYICRGISTFSVYSKEGWIHFPVNDETIVVTIGEHIQVLSGGLYKHVIGKPIFQNAGGGGGGGGENPISIEFLYSHPIPAINNTSSSLLNTTTKSGEQKKIMISLSDQVMIAACLTFLYHIIIYILYA